MGKLERLLNLTAALLNTERPLSADELRVRVDGYPQASAAFRRAFERDKDDLREMGVPIVLTRIPGSDPPIEGYRIPPDEYYLPDPNLEPDELAALRLAAGAVRVEGTSGAEVIRKLGGADEPKVEAILTVPADSRLSTMFDALASRRLLGFVYSETERVVEPGRLDLVRGRWYLSGHDRTRNDVRHFRLDRIESDVTVGEADAFTRDSPPNGVRIKPWELGEETPTTARVLVDAEYAHWAGQHVNVPIDVQRDGSIVLEFPVSNKAAFRSFVLTFLEHAEILDPPELRSDMVEWLSAIAADRGERS